jgi:hypothetical protein
MQPRYKCSLSSLSRSSTLGHNLAPSLLAVAKVCALGAIQQLTATSKQQQQQQQLTPW